MKKYFGLLFCFLLISSLSFSAVINIKEGHLDAVTDVVKYPFGNVAITCSNDETVIIWDLNKNKIIKTFEIYKGALTCLAISPGGKYFVAGSKNGQVFIFDFDAKKQIDAPKLHSGKINSVVFSDKENVFATAGIDGTIAIYDIDQRTIVKGLSMPSKIISLEISPDKQTLAAGDDQGTVYLIPTATYTAFTSFKNHSNWVSGLAFSPDSKTLASVDWNFNLSLYSMEKKAPYKKVLLPTEKPLNSITWSPDNKYVAISCSDSNIYVYDAVNFKPAFTLEGHKKQVLKAIFFPDSSALLSVSSDATLKEWDLSNPDSPQLMKTCSGY